MNMRGSCFALSFALPVMAVAPSAGAGPSTGEECLYLFTKPSQTPARIYVGSHVDVLGPTEREERFAPTVPSEIRIVEIDCLRRDIVPAPNDYKVMAAGFAFSIKASGAEPERVVIFEHANGHVNVTVDQGPPLSAELAARMKARLDEFDAKLNASR
jgi:hypothetical protein